MERNDWFEFNGIKHRVEDRMLTQVLSHNPFLITDLSKVQNISVTLHKMPQTVMHCKTQKEYDDLMETYKKGGWRWCGGDKPTTYNAWKEHGEETCIRIKSWFQYGKKEMYEVLGDTIFTFDEFIDRQLNWEDECDEADVDTDENYMEEMIRKISMLSSLCTESITNETKQSIIPLNSMSLRDKARNLLLSKKEKQLRKHHLKDECGNWTQTAREIYLEQQMNKDDKAFDDLLAELEGGE